MQSKAKDVDTYMKGVKQDRQEALARLRELCQRILVGYEESMDYGMPCYKKGRVVEIAFASQKQYIAFYVLKEEVLDKHRHLLEGLSLGKGSIRYTKPEKIDFDVVEQLLTESLHSDSEIC
jgi:uncharacterized protein YdhG (YjbR/CyaY superfamily)